VKAASAEHANSISALFCHW